MTPHEMEQGLANMRDTLPRIWAALYQGCLVAGFNQVQAFALVATYILSQNPAGIRPSDQSGPKGDGE